MADKLFIKKRLIKGLMEENDKKITCKKCSWKWMKSEAGSDMYFCHKCGHDNTPDNIMEEENKKIVGGVLIKCTKTNRVFLLLRNDKVPSWALMSGGIDKGENVLEGLKREMMEELFVKPTDIEFKHIGVERIPSKNMDFHYFEGYCNYEFKPILDHENLQYMWTDMNHLPSPLYNGLLDKIKNILK